MSSKSLTPTNIRVDRKQSLTHTRIVSTFTLGFEHEITYERHDRVIGGDIIIKLDGQELVRDTLYSLAIGDYKKHFDIEGEPIGLIRITGFGIFFVRVYINGVPVFRT